MTEPFIDVSVLPMYGKHQAVLTWRVTAGHEKGKFIIFKSPDGTHNWKEIGNVPGIMGSFTDTEMIPRGKWDEAFYKLVLQFKGKRYDSDVVSTFGTLKRTEFGVARTIMMHEWEALRIFTPVKFFKLRTDGPICPKCTDADTGQQIGISLCPVCYGTGFEGGFYPALDSFLHIGVMGSKVQEDSREGTGASDPVQVHGRMPAYPMLEKNDMIVNPTADRRYLVDKIDLAWLNGKIPVYAEADLTLLPRNNIRYTFPL